MPSVKIIYRFGENGIKYKEKDKNQTQFLQHIKRIEENIITNLRKGFSLDDQVQRWKNTINQINDNWSTIMKKNVVVEDFMMGIVILQKLKVDMGINYGWTIVKRRKIKSCKVCQTDTRLKCSGCHKAYYCCGSCQNADWKIHKKTCC